MPETLVTIIAVILSVSIATALAYYLVGYYAYRNQIYELQTNSKIMTRRLRTLSKQLGNLDHVARDLEALEVSITSSSECPGEIRKLQAKLAGSHELIKQLDYIISERNRDMKAMQDQSILDDQYYQGIDAENKALTATLKTFTDGNQAAAAEVLELQQRLAQAETLLVGRSKAIDSLRAKGVLDQKSFASIMKAYKALVNDQSIEVPSE